MKFCSVGAVKLKSERNSADMYQYLFDKNTAKPTDIPSFVSMIKNARSISYNKDASNNLDCSPMAGIKGNKLFLTYVNVAPQPSESGSNLYTMSTNSVTRTALDMFKQFCCVNHDWFSAKTLTTGDASIFQDDIAKYNAAYATNPFLHPVKSGNGVRMVLYPTKVDGIGTTTRTTTLSYTYASSQSFSYSYSNNTGGTTYYYSYTSYNNCVWLNTDAFSYNAINLGGISLSAGTSDLLISNRSSSGIQLSRPTYSYTVSTNGGSSSTSYSQGVYQSTSSNNTQNSALPSMAWTGTDESVALGFGAIASREWDKFVIFIRNFGSDLTHVDGATEPNIVPAVKLVTSVAISNLQTVVSL